MATNVGDLVVKFGADFTEFVRAMDRAVGPRSALASVGKVAAGAAAAAGVAIAGFAGKGIADFQALDTGMREVFTLLPGITRDAMDDMQDEVLAFSNAFGKLPDEVVPALYQALSAGVPQDNVFTFMEVAAQTAIGGVATMEEAVDVLSSVVNAYGAENVSANEASDILFTTVRLGKTDMSQLASVISRVTPIANSLGVGFDDVGAAMAALTATGVPTAEAATQLRSLMAELADSGAGVGQMFTDLAGMTFPEFIAGGGTLEEALVMLSDQADEMGRRIGDSFGSIEAGMAATVLTSENGSVLFGNAMAEMQNASGATEAAFEQMDSGIGASWNRLKANFATLSAEVGEALAPMFKEGVDWVVQVGMPMLRDGVKDAFDRIQEFTTTLTAAWERYQTDTDGIFATVRAIVESAAGFLQTAFQLMQSAWETILKPTWDAIAPLAEAVFNAVGTIVSTVFESIEAVMRGLISFMHGDFETAWNSFNHAIVLINEGIRDALVALWNGVRDFLAGLFDGMVTAAGERWNEMSTAIQAVTEGLRTWLQDTWNGIKEWLGTLFGNIATNAGIRWDGVVGAIKGAFDGLRDWVQSVFDGVANAIESALGGIQAAAEGVMDFVNRVLGRAGDAERAANDAAAALADAEANAASGGSSAAGGDAGGGIGDAGGRALGGIVTGPMRALVGEAGPEAIIPLDRLDRMLASVTGTAGNQTIIFEVDGREMARVVAPRMVDNLRLKTGLAGTL